MDLSRETFQLCGFFHPDLFCEEPATYPSSTFPSLQFIEEILSIEPEKWFKGLHVLDPLWEFSPYTDPLEHPQNRVDFQIFHGIKR